MRRWSLMLLAVGLAALAGAAAKDSATTVGEQIIVKTEGGAVLGRLSASGDGVVFELVDVRAQETAAAEAAAAGLRERERRAHREQSADIRPGSRAHLTLSPDGISSLALRDGGGHARFQVSTDKDGATTLAILDGRGNTVWGVRADAVGRVRLQAQPSVTPTGKHETP
jgi:catechol 2,3-dioxygenase-like lactoylglutathione lyase family enzyme